MRGALFVHVHRYALSEVVSSEVAYVQQLNALITLYVDPLRVEAAKDDGFISSVRL